MHSLSARLLILTAFFVMLVEVFVFVPSVARYREDWLGARLSAAHLAMLALDAAPDRAVGEMLRAELLSQVGAHLVLVRRGGASLVLGGSDPPEVSATYRLADDDPWDLIVDALAVYTHGGGRTIRVLSPSPADPGIEIDLVLDEDPMRRDMLAFGMRIFLLSVVISVATAGLVYLSLQWLLVRPMRRIADSMNAFSENPEDVRHVIRPSGRRDEIGRAERQLAAMQDGLRAALTQKAHLAALGIAVAKINHDLRGMLSSALVVSDRLETSEDPEVRRLAPTLIDAIDRAVALCGQTLAYAGSGRAEARRERFQLRPVAAEIGATLEAPGGGAVAVENAIPEDCPVEGDRDQIFRILGNLCRNAAEAGATGIELSAAAAAGSVAVDVRDNGPGLAPRAREKLFQPFEGSARAGGTGLGLAISRELARAHGGDLTLVSSDRAGTHFRLSLPRDEANPRVGKD